MSHPEFPQKKSIFVVEPQAIFRLGLKHFLEEVSDLKVLGEAGILRGAMAAILEASPNLVILEISFPDGNGLELIKQLRVNLFNGAILVLSNHDESLYAERALRAGANGYLMKSEKPDRIIEAVRSVLRNEIYVSVAMNAHLLQRMAGGGGVDPGRSRLEQLTNREIEVLEFIGMGMKTRNIGEHLSISSKTVDTHRINIRQKLGISDVNELIRFAVHWLGSETVARH